jgi:hypothetical protein
MPELLARLREEMAARRAQEAVEARRDTLRDLALTALQCFLWSFAGIALIGWALHTTDVGYGRMAFWAGVAVGNGGIIFTLLAAYRRGEKRGDW